ncbi:MAG: hypothetical protein ABS97_05605 [Lysobacteraceae bacterium SCN 69-320]|nr:MAG: hypothetical protein ABS97_05605 [Xanthomonadaceae bacterium SCN 69-320]
MQHAPKSVTAPPGVLPFLVRKLSGDPFDGAAVGVGQPVNSATVLRLLSLFPAALLPFCAGVPAIGVGQPASIANAVSLSGLPRVCASRSASRSARNSADPPALCQSLATGVGHPAQPLSDVRCADARSAKICCCAGVALTFKVN